MKPSVSNPEIDDDELICPITWEIFRDPVIATDGHVYEREAITTWILQNGTSPLTREPLKVEELQSDDHLRQLAVQRHNSTVSYNTRVNKVTLPSIQPAPLIITRTCPGQVNPIVVNHHSNKLRCKHCAALILGFLFIIFIIVGLIITGKEIAKNSKSGTHELFFSLLI